LQVNVWNNLCLDLFQRLDVNALIMIEGYKFSLSKHSDNTYIISLNPSNPKAVVTTIDGLLPSPSSLSSLFFFWLGVF